MRSFFTTALLAAAAAHVQAIQITAPGKNDEVDITKGVTVKWTTVSTDPTRANLVLVNKASGHTPFTLEIGEVDLSKGSIVVTEKNVPADEGFQFNFESLDELNTGILAQSEQFEIESPDNDSDDETSSSTAKTTAKTTSAASATETSTSDDAETTTDADSTETSAVPTTLTTASTTGTATDAPEGSGTATESASTTASTGAAATQAVGGVLALVAGVLAVMA